MKLLNGAPITREQWLNECGEMILDEIIRPVWNVRKNLKVKISVGFAPDTKSTSKTIGVCLPSAFSNEAFNEIYISPVINESLRVLDVLTHELIHAVDDCKSGHKGDFVSLMHKTGLEGKPTATTASPELTQKLSEYVGLFGHIPHAKVDLRAKPKQLNRNIKVLCASCGFKFNTSRTQIDHILSMQDEICCNACGEEMICPDY